MSSSLLPHTASSRLLTGILTALAVTSLSACREGHEQHASYTPGQQRQQAFVEGNTWPPLPCLPRTDPRLTDLPHDCMAEDYEVIAGPNLVTNEAGEATCNYRITFTTERGVSCVVGRPLRTAEGSSRIAALAANAAWSV